MKRALVVGALGAAGVALGLVRDPDRTLAGYLAAWCATVTLSLGGLAVLAIGYATNATWPAVVRRLCETIAAALLPLAVLGVPLLVGAARVWPWAADSRGLPNRAYLSLPVFAIRYAIYFAIWIALAELLGRRSRRRDAHPAAELDLERGLSSAALPILGITGTLAAIDWLMSLQPTWWSAGFGLYILVGGLGAAVALVILLAWRSPVPARPPHFHALARLLHAFVILWAYLAYFQAMLIQLANKPREVGFFVDRWDGGAWIATVLVAVLGFALPFLLLFPRALKRRAGYAGGVAVLVLVAHYVEAWWLVLPRGGQVPVPSWLDLAAIAAVVGLAAAACALRMRGVSLVATGDPYLASGLAYEAAP
ncbi:MAG TPA: hypothetical protein VGM88_11260 [Kofleriaceae bacterium]